MPKKPSGAQTILVAALLAFGGCQSSVPKVDPPAKQPSKTEVGDQLIEPFLPHLSEYLAYFPDAPQLNRYSSARNRDASIRGKLITVQAMMTEYDPKVGHSVIRKGKLHEAFLDLPQEIRAETPANVQTIVRLDCQENPVGKYIGAPMGGVADQETCRVEIIDLEKKRVISETLLSGEMPPDKSKTAIEFGSLSNAVIVGYLSSLPRR